MAEEAKRQACRDCEDEGASYTLKGKVESFATLRGFGIDAMNQNYTVLI